MPRPCILRSLWVAVCVAMVLCGCGSRKEPAPPRLTIAAAANLTGVFDEIGAAFRRQTGVQAVMSYGSTAQLAQQIGNGAPYDVFAAADTQHVDALSAKGLVAAGSRFIYARGQLAVWAPRGGELGIRALRDLTSPSIRFVAIAQPGFAPYGRAAVEAIKASGLWDALLPKLVYANNINMARELAASGNADAAFTAYSLVLTLPGTTLKVNPSLYGPIDQAACAIASSPRLVDARRFTDFLAGPECRSILARRGYLVP